LDVFPLILKSVAQCDVKHIMTLPIKIVMSNLKVLTYIITSIAARPIWTRCDSNDISCKLTFRTGVILYMYIYY